MHSWSRPPFVVSTDKSLLDVSLIHGFLRETYWSPQIPRHIVERALENSLSFGVYRDAAQIGFARVISDSATLAYLADVFVLEEWRGQGVSKFLLECIKSHPDLQQLRRWLLFTADAHGLYEQYGFTPLAKPERAMEIADSDIYRRLAPGEP